MDNTIRHEWQQKKSPSLHAVFELFTDCLSGRDRMLSATAGDLKKGPARWIDMDRSELKNQCIKLYARLNLMIQYLGIMHERNELSAENWDFPRPLYNFVSLKEDNKSK
ncbi:hypothetical protein [Oceanispirochaeta sp.]|uniref:hypothetical protein n=1 Tax=Oceanispirochaeta sp. TaxID=2035350 RepID=UPI0026370993|nr:hypothetical protein [Oceanispirochaeta sp.]MDA3955151.1 hypothetical protein [Oceanispirochaeta sp.]